MAAFPCPYCGRQLLALADSDSAEFGGVDAKGSALGGLEFGERCPNCAGSLQIAYRYRLCEHHGPISGGELYRAIDDGFGKAFAVVFVAEPDDPAAVERFVAGNQLFADLGGCGLVKIYEASSTRDQRAHVVMDWLEGGTLDKVVARRGAGLEQGALLQLITDLLTGLSKAHRSMPTIVHGHIHPGKIGFRQRQQAVLFGFEWATTIARASQLADTFTSAPEVDEPRTVATDLRQLGAVVYYAATGEWIGELGRAEQRARVRAQVPGPLGRLLERLFGAGVDGYRSAVDAAMDFEQLMRGADRWQAPSVVALDRSEERMGTAWTQLGSSPGGLEPGYYDDGDEDDDEDEHEHEYVDESWPTPEPSRSPSSPDPSVWAATRQAQARADALAQAQAQAQIASTSAKPGRVIGFAIGAMVVFGTCVAGILEDRDTSYVPPPSFEPQVRVEPIPPPRRDPVPEPVFEPEPAEPEPVFEPEPEPTPAQPGMLGTFLYTGTVVGPSSYAGLALGETCEIRIEPHVSSQGNRLNCRWYVDCGQPRRRIYGGGTAGYSTCILDDDGRVLRAEDQDDDAPDGAFIADFESEEAMLVVLDRWTLPPVHALISVEGGELSHAPIPKVAHAPRVPESVIAARIDAGDYPIVEPGVLAEDW